MKQIVLLIIVAGAVVTGGCATKRQQMSSGIAESATGAPIDASLSVKGMSCPLCAHNITQQLEKVDGVEKVTIDLGSGKVNTWFLKGRKPALPDLKEAVRKSGFTLTEVELADRATIVCVDCTCTNCDCASKKAADRCGAKCRCRPS